jgi:cytochrome b6-f complex iron-sulfur subunit
MDRPEASARLEEEAVEGKQPVPMASSRPAPVALAEDVPAAIEVTQDETDAPAATRPTDEAIADAAQAGRPSGAGAPVAPRGNGAAASAAPAATVAAIPAAAAAADAQAEEDPEARARRMMNRREFLTYTWAAALGLVALQAGVGTFLFMYPRFKAGEFGGEFFLGPVDSMPATDAPPVANTAGKFWLVNTTDEGVKAIYMVCTHLGCLYKWEPSTVRFECPCHGSKFNREGFYIEGPAPRSLDTFAVREENGEVIVDTGSKITGAPSSESPARAA